MNMMTHAFVRAFRKKGYSIPGVVFAPKGKFVRSNNEALALPNGYGLHEGVHIVDFSDSSRYNGKTYHKAYNYSQGKEYSFRLHLNMDTYDEIKKEEFLEHMTDIISDLRFGSYAKEGVDKAFAIYRAGKLELIAEDIRINDGTIGKILYSEPIDPTTHFLYGLDYSQSGAFGIVSENGKSQEEIFDILSSHYSKKSLTNYGLDNVPISLVDYVKNDKSTIIVEDLDSSIHLNEPLMKAIGKRKEDSSYSVEDCDSGADDSIVGFIE